MIISSLSRVLSIAAVLVAVVALAAVSKADQSMTSGSAGSTADVAHGKYLVQNVGGCADCHGEKLQGQPLPFKPTIPMPWVGRSPKIAGLPMFKTDAAAIRFLHTGIDQHGYQARPPMPAYRFSNADARDVVAYLRSLRT